MSISPVRLNHAVLFVADLERSLRFYTDVFGMEIVTHEARMNAAFLRLPRSGNHHDLGLFGVGTADGPRRRGAIGLYHLAWQLDTIDELAAARQTLLEARAYVGESSHGATKSLYGADPDGNEFELMWMLPRSEWGPYEHSAPIIISISPERFDGGAVFTPRAGSSRNLALDLHSYGEESSPEQQVRAGLAAGPHLTWWRGGDLNP